MTAGEYTKRMIQELEETLSALPEEGLGGLTEKLLGAGRIYVAGAGRSGYAMRSFAMRLVHLGLTAYVVGDTVTPAIREGDLLLIGSGSGSTSGLLSMAQKARKIGADLALVTTRADSPIGALASLTLRLPAPTKETGSASLQPMGSLFEQALLLTLDTAVLLLMERTGQTAQEMAARHANLE